MALRNNLRVACYGCVMAGMAFVAVRVRADDASDTKEQLRLLQQQNQALQEQLRQQQGLIDSLTRKVNEIQEANAQRGQEMEDLKAHVQEPAPGAKESGGFSLGKVSISGEGGVALFESGSQGLYPNGEFRVDEARLFVEAPIWDSVYFYSELNFITREAPDLSVKLGELYLDFENLSRLWGKDHQLNLRAGRFYIPFGEEYLYRYAIDNPLISHSLSDLWGVDEGLAFYGNLGKFSYMLAVQNGGPSGVRDFTADKSVAGRVGFDPNNWLHLSVSAMRTGDLDAQKDLASELWFANGWFVPIGSKQTTRFHANLAEGDVAVRWQGGHLRAFGGVAHYDDNDPNANNQRDIFYYSVEGVQNLTGKLYTAARFGQILVDKGYPLAANGNMGQYLFSGIFTDEIWRLSLGLGYRWSPNLVLKTEYSFERGETVGGVPRNHEDLFATEIAFKF